MADGAGKAADFPAANPSPSEKDDLTHDQLLGQLQPMIQNARSPELTILRLVLNYSFNVSHLKSLLAANKLDLSLSNVNYAEVCQHVGLLARKKGSDIPTFDMHPARLPDDFFWDYLEDMKIATFQYGRSDIIPIKKFRGLTRGMASK